MFYILLSEPSIHFKNAVKLPLKNPNCSEKYRILIIEFVQEYENKYILLTLADSTKTGRFLKFNQLVPDMLYGDIQRQMDSEKEIIMNVLFSSILSKLLFYFLDCPP